MQTKPIPIEALIEHMRIRNIQLWTEDAVLKFKAPKGVMEPADLQLLKEYKTKIIAYLADIPTRVTVQHDLLNRYKPFPLTDVQSAYLLGRNPAFAYGDVACHLYLELKYPSLDRDRVEQCWNVLIQRHEMLRASISPQGFQTISEHAPAFIVGYQDISLLAASKQATVLEAIRSSMSHRVYDTTQWPLFDIAITATRQKSQPACILHFSMEFLIADWSSMMMLLAEFEMLYFEASKPLKPIDVSFRDYVIAERALRETPAYYRDRNYWMKRVETLPSAPMLPLKRREYTAKNHFTRNSCLIKKKNWDSFKANASSFGITPTAAVAAAFAAVLERWSEHAHFCLNLTVLNRRPLHPDVDRVVGDFTSLSLLEIDFREQKNFFEHAKDLNIQLFNDLDHTVFTAVELLREIAKVKQNGSILYPVVLTSAIGLFDNRKDLNLTGQMGDYSISQTPQVFLDCQVVDSLDGLTVNWDARDGIFPDQLVEDMFVSFELLLNALATAIDNWHIRALISLPPWQQKERERVDNEPAPLPQVLLHTPILKNCKKLAYKIAIVDQFGAITYETLAHKAANIALQLQHLGCSAAARVAITIPKSHHQVTAVMAVLAIGAVYVPIDSHQPAARMDKIIKNAGIRFIITTQEFLDHNCITENKLLAIAVDRLEAKTTVSLENIASTAQQTMQTPAYISYTSGSTGEPKGVVISHLGAKNTIEDMHRRFGIRQEDTLLALSQLGFDLSVFDIFGLLAVGGTLIYPHPARQQDPSHWLELMLTYGVSLWNTAPALLQMLVDYLETEGVQHIEPRLALRLVLLSGDWIPLPLPDRLLSYVPKAQIVSLGGATEASIWSFFYLYTRLNPDWVSIPYGRPLSNQGCCILDKQMRDCPVWKSGDLYITGSGLALAYLNDAELTHDRFLLHPVTGASMYKTGDLARFCPGGDIEFLGRVDKQLKIRGHRIEIGEIEAALAEHPQVAHAAVIAKSLSEISRQKCLFAFIVPTVQGAEASLHSELMEFLRDRIPAYMLPAQVSCLQRMPLTLNGKLDIKQLEDLCVFDVENSTSDSLSFQDDLEQRIYELCCNALSLRDIKRTQNLNELGADSLIFAQLAGKMRDIFSSSGQKDLSFDFILRQLISSPSIAALADFFRCHQQVSEVSKPRAVIEVPPRLGVCTNFSDNGAAVQRIIIQGDGTWDNYKPLIRYLLQKPEQREQPQYAVYGISIGDTAAYCALDEDKVLDYLADDYTSIILENGARQVQLIGYSIGSMVAVEIARRLSEKGIDIVDLSIIDALAAPFKVYDSLFIEFRFLPNLNIDLADAGFGEINGPLFMAWLRDTLAVNNNELPEGAIFTLSGRPELAPMASVFKRLNVVPQKDRFMAYSSAIKRLHNRDIPVELLERSYAIFVQNFKASKYIAPPYFGDIRYFKAKDHRTTAAKDINDNTLSIWADLCLGTLQVTEIDGDHWTCLGPKYAAALAAALNKPFQKELDR
ncbi:amino acid adenylation domain-containing protein [Sphingobacterium sp. Mn56C]|uniref:amino acid adenylation domain-containing protein n=1 Tax=Sphingobacterium sp. Mn56C TaxID=3395261 RepID=UPI003BBF85C6